MTPFLVSTCSAVLYRPSDPVCRPQEATLSRKGAGFVAHAEHASDSMERQRSFSLKPSRLALFSFTLATFLLICLSLFPRGGAPPRLSLEGDIQFTSVLWSSETRSSSETERSNFERRVSVSSRRGDAGEGSGGAHLVVPGDTGEEAEGSGGGWEDDAIEETHSKESAGSSNAAPSVIDEDGDDKDAGLLESDDDAAVETPDSDDSDGEWEVVVPEGDDQVGGSPNSTNATLGAGSSATLAAVGHAGGGSGEALDASAPERNASQSESSEVREEMRAPSIGRIEEARPAADAAAATCDFSSGRWVFDESYPLYTNQTCPFIDEGFSCQSNGRPDTDYMKWRWQPHNCKISRFDAVKMLELIRGKRLVFVGDSMNRNQWESLMCMLMQGVRDPKRVVEARGQRITKQRGNYNFKFLDYHCSVEYYVTHFLVREGKARVSRKRVQTLRIDAIDRSSSKWRGADILVFNTAHWWNHHKTKAGKNYFQEGDQVHPQLDVSTAFRKALLTWASWVDRSISPRRTQVFFRSSSPSHFSGGEWNSGGHCRESTRPLNETFAARIVPTMNVIAEQVINQMKSPVTLMKVTQLSGLRIDGHPSVYGTSGRRRNVQDCSHWCLPGVPDAWNEMLYFHLLSNNQKPISSH